MRADTNPTPGAPGVFLISRELQRFYFKLAKSEDEEGPLPVDLEGLRRIAGATPKQWREHGPVLDLFFPVHWQTNSRRKAELYGDTEWVDRIIFGGGHA